MLTLRLAARLSIKTSSSVGIFKSCHSSTNMERPIVNLGRDAALRGKVLHANDSTKPVYTYLGVPFAEPPVNERRFKPPKPLQLWSGVKEATRFGPQCPQPLDALKLAFPRYDISDAMSEDCLYLNVYTPVNDNTNHNMSGDGKRLLPVMVWIHGGAFVLGSGDIYDGRALAAHHDVIVVTINYRLGIFGYLWTPDGHISGNMGQLDQVEALRWVHKYIGHFGGDKDNVTLFGESAGAISVALHTVSPLTRGLFHRAICESGTALYPSVVWSTKNATKFLKSSLREHGCDSIDGKTVEAFLNKMSGEELAEKFVKAFGRVVDGHYLPAHPLDLYRAGRFQPVDLLCGFNTHEGFLLISLIVGPIGDIIRTKKDAEAFVKMSLTQTHYRGNPQRKEICERACRVYLDDIPDEDIGHLTERCTQVQADSTFTAPTVLTATHHSSKARTFMYEFNHRPSFSRNPTWMVSDHTDEIPYVFGEPFVSSQSWPAVDTVLSRQVMTYWSNFAKTGDPNDSALPHWPQFSQDAPRYIQLQECPLVATNYKPKITEFWNKTALDLAFSSPFENSKL